MRMRITSATKSAQIFCLWFAFLLLVASPLLAQQSAVQPPPTVVFMTDFGVVDDSVALCKGVMYGIAPNLRIVDLTHQVNAFSIRDGARFLFGATPYFPAGTVFVVVIDPGVGSARKAVVVKSKRGQFFVLPDNGLMTMVEDRDGVEGHSRSHESRLDGRRQRFPPPSMAGISSLPSARTSRAATTGPRSDPKSRSWSGSI